MSNLEAAQGQFLYEYRDGCSSIALIQLILFIVSFIFTYNVWWSGLFGVLVAMVGYYGSMAPVVQNKVSFIQFYYFGNCFIFFLQMASVIILIVFVSDMKVVTAWGWAQVTLGTMLLLGQLALTWTAIQRSNSYRAELMRNPPPAEMMVYTSDAMYIPVSQSKPM